MADAPRPRRTRALLPLLNFLPDVVLDGDNELISRENFELLLVGAAESALVRPENLDGPVLGEVLDGELQDAVGLGLAGDEDSHIQPHLPTVGFRPDRTGDVGGMKGRDGPQVWSLTGSPSSCEATVMPSLCAEIVLSGI